MIKIFYVYISLAKTIFIIMKFKKNDYYYENLNYYHAYLQGNFTFGCEMYGSYYFIHQCMIFKLIFINV